MNKSLLCVIRSGPYSSASGVEAIDLAINAASFEMAVALVLVEDAVFHVRKQQQGPLKQLAKTFQALQDFDIEAVYVDDASLVARGLTVDDLQDQVDVVCASQITDLVKRASQVIAL